MGAGLKIPVGVVGVGVADIDRARAEEVGKRLRVSSTTDYRELLGRVRCVSVAVPTRLHYEVSREFLGAGIDVLVEKPMAATLDQGREIVALAREKGCVLQVGHLERVNPAIRRLEDRKSTPLNSRH